MNSEGKLCGKAEQPPYYLEALDKLTGLADQIGKQIGELETRIETVLAGNTPMPPQETQKETRGPACSLEERLASLVGQFSVRRNDLGMILRRIRL